MDGPQKQITVAVSVLLQDAGEATRSLAILRTGGKRRPKRSGGF